MKTLKVKELVKLLQDADQEANVHIEGCDCIGAVIGISMPTEESAYSGSVIVRQKHGALHGYKEEGEIKDAKSNAT